MIQKYILESDDLKHLEIGLRIALTDWQHNTRDESQKVPRKVTHYLDCRGDTCQGEEDPKKRVLVLWTTSRPWGGLSPLRFPAPLDLETTFNTVRLWLDEVEYPPEPDHDGSNSKGFRLEKNLSWDFNHGAECTIEPIWVEYHK